MLKTVHLEKDETTTPLGVRLTQVAITVAILAQAMQAPHKQKSLRFKGLLKIMDVRCEKHNTTFHATRAYVR